MLTERERLSTDDLLKKVVNFERVEAELLETLMDSTLSITIKNATLSITFFLSAQFLESILTINGAQYNNTQHTVCILSAVLLPLVASFTYF